jgi:integrase/recombinase XerD
VRAYLAELTERNLASWTVNGHARAIRTLLIFWHTEGYMPELVKFAMPKVEKKRLPSLDAYQLKLVLGSCKTVRDKAIIMTFADSGLRRGEVIALNWGDVDISSGLIRVNRGKGGKARSVVVGAKTRRALLAYRRTLVHRDDHHPLFQTTTGGRFAPEGLRTALLRIGERAGIHLSPHALRRTFTILSLRAGMDLLHLQAMLGHESLEMVRHYAQLSDVDLLEEHKKHSPVDNL